MKQYVKDDSSSKLIYIILHKLKSQKNGNSNGNNFPSLFNAKKKCVRNFSKIKKVSNLSNKIKHDYLSVNLSVDEIGYHSKIKYQNLLPC